MSEQKFIDKVNGIPVRFPKTSLSYIYDSENNIVKCAKCDKKATSAVMGYDAYIAYCNDHWMGEDDQLD